MELLVVIAIIGLLISILLPSLSKARSTAVTVLCQSNQRQVNAATIQYTVESKGFIPTWHAAPKPVLHHPPAQKLADLKLIPLIDPLDPYATNTVRFCPLLTADEPAKLSNHPGEQSLIHHVPSVHLSGYTNGLAGTVPYPHKKMASIKNSSSIYLNTESPFLMAVGKVVNTSITDGNHRFRAGANSGVGTETARFDDASIGGFRHDQDRVNFSFLDGHGETIAYDEATKSFGRIHYTDYNPWP